MGSYSKRTGKNAFKTKKMGTHLRQQVQDQGGGPFPKDTDGEGYLKKGDSRSESLSDSRESVEREDSFDVWVEQEEKKESLTSHIFTHQKGMEKKVT